MGRLLPRTLPTPPDPRVRAWDVLDVGAMNVGERGSYRELVVSHGMNYIGMDERRGPNVDLVATVDQLDSGSFDLIISGQMLEHDTFPMRTMIELKRALKPGGWMIHIAPFVWAEHRHPVDCWRFLPDGMRMLLEGFDQVESEIVEKDCYVIGRKPQHYEEPWVIQRRFASPVSQSTQDQLA